jgi:formylglycine-generating enzyme required for sulfatase activity
MDPHEEPVDVPGFKVLRELGRGAMGVVYLAFEEALRRHVALKVLRPGISDSPELRARFEREVRAAARIRHPNIVPVLSTGEARGRLWYAMEYVEGLSLDRVLHESGAERLPAARVARIVRDLARVLAAAHAAGVTHRDVKPGNVVLQTEAPPDVEAGAASRRVRATWLRDDAGEPDHPVVDRPLLMDFGLAADATAARLSESGMLIGTPGYMAPEQFSGRAGDVGPACDQWALGVMLYECLTGRLPFPSDDLPTLARFVAHEHPVPPRRLDPRIDQDLETICLECLEKDPKDRYEDCGALADDLSRWLREETIKARPPGPVRRFRAWARHRPKTVTAIVAVLVAVCVTAAVLFAQGRERLQRIERVAAAARDALAAGRFDEAEARFGEWIALDAAAADARDGLDRARARREVRLAEETYLDAARRMERVRVGDEDVEDLERRAAMGRLVPDGQGLGSQEARGSEPWWMREPAYRARIAAERRREELVRERAEVAAALAVARSAVDAAAARAGSEGLRVRQLVFQGSARWHMEEWRLAVRRGDGEAAAIHRIAVEQLDPGPYRDELEGDGDVVVAPSDPPAEAWLFRYAREGEALDRGGPRLLPLPFPPAALGRAALPVPQAYRDAVEKRLEGEGARPPEPDVPSITPPFLGTATHVGTMEGPLGRARYARLLAESAYPLVSGPENAAGLLDAERTLRLPMGRYLLLLRAPGRADVRLPFEVGRRERVVLAPGRLPHAGEVPPGFVHVAGGTFAIGGDDAAPNAAPLQVVTVGSFLAGRYEVTYDEYWEFLNDPRTLREIDDHAAQGLRFVPRIGDHAIPRRGERGYETMENPERPVANVSFFDFTGYLAAPPGEDEPRDEQFQALAESLQKSQSIGWGYLAWRTERSIERASRAGSDGGVEPDVVVVPGPDGAPQRRAMLFTLPTETEWERMARGGQRRIFVYGDEREWSCFKGSRSRRRNAAPEPIGLFPEDESVFGVRDLTGSVAEWTASWKEVGGAFWVRGHSWGSQVPEDDRIAARSAAPPSRASATVGFRVIVRESRVVERSDSGR